MKLKRINNLSVVYPAVRSFADLLVYALNSSSKVVRASEHAMITRATS